MEEKILDKICDWLDDNIFDYIETKSRGHEEILKRVNVSALLSDLRNAMQPQKGAE